MPEQPSVQFTPISQLGEFKLIDHITAPFPTLHAGSLKLVGDDCAQLAFEPGHHSVVSTDMFVQGVHFDLDYFPLQHLGHKVVVAAISDVFAMNARPSHILVSLALSSHFSVEMLELFYQGIATACQEYQIDLAGGDTTTIARGFVISITAIGSANPNQVVYRSGAQVNDLICVTGDLGAAYLGLQLLEREKKVFQANPQAQPELREENHYLYQRFLHPDCRDDVWKYLAQKQVTPTAMIDISDGLSSELIHLGQQSNVGIRIYEDKLPIHPVTMDVAKEFHMEPLTCALNGGEDYELLFTISQADYPAVAANREVSVIGHTTATAGRYELMSSGGNPYPLVAQGWQPFGPDETP